MDTRAQVLVVDDEESMVRVVERVLVQANYRVLTASTARQAMRLMRENRPDVALLDVVLGSDDGFEVCRQIKSDPDLARTFVIMMSGIRRGPDDLADGLDIGADEYLTKPLSGRELVARINALLRLRSVENALRESQSWLVAVLGSLHGTVVAVLDRTGVYMDVWEDPAYEELYGVSASELIGTSVAGLLPPGASPELLDALADVADGQETRTLEVRLCFPNGEFWHEACLSPLHGQDGETSAIVVCSHDITLRKRMEEELRQAREELALLRESRG